MIAQGKSVPQIRIFQSDLGGNLSPENQHYLQKVLRLKTGDLFFITDGLGNECKAKLESPATYLAMDKTAPAREPRFSITAFVPLLKGDRLEFLIEKLVELGVTRFIPFLSKNSVVSTPSKGKLERWQKIACAAMLQCGGCLLPKIEAPTSLREFPPRSFPFLSLFLHEEFLPSKFALPVKQSQTNVVLASGPEGGFSSDEVTFLLDQGWHPLWLGNRRLRADTAPIAAVAALTVSENLKDTPMA